MRILSNSVRNEQIINDAISGTKLKFYYRIPSTTEITNYFTQLYKKRGDETYLDPQVRVDGALNVLTGFETGNFGDEKGNPISSDPGESNYREDWKDLLKQTASDLLTLLAIGIFESSALDMKKESNGKIIGEKLSPLPLSSGDGSTQDVLLNEKSSV